MRNNTEFIENKVEINDILKELTELADLVVNDTVDKLLNYLKEENEEAFYDKVNRAKSYRNGYILKLFLAKTKNLGENLTDQQKSMINYIKKII